MQQDKKLQSVFESFAADLQEYIKVEVERQVSAAIRGSGNTSVSKPAASKANIDVLTQLREEVADKDFFSEEKLNELKELAMKNPRKAPDVVSNSQTFDFGSLMSEPKDESDEFDTSKLDFLAKGKDMNSSLQSSNQEMKENKYTPGFAGLRQLLDKVRKYSI